MSIIVAQKNYFPARCLQSSKRDEAQCLIHVDIGGMNFSNGKGIYDRKRKVLWHLELISSFLSREVLLKNIFDFFN
jgi:hypothetical protein